MAIYDINAWRILLEVEYGRYRRLVVCDGL